MNLTFKIQKQKILSALAKSEPVQICLSCVNMSKISQTKSEFNFSVTKLVICFGLLKLNTEIIFLKENLI